jgi:hypothetical protein
MLYDTVIPRNVRVSEAPSHGKPVLLYDLKCPGSQAYLTLASKIIQREARCCPQFEDCPSSNRELKWSMTEEASRSGHRQRLGRGLAALLGNNQDDSARAANSLGIRKAPIDLLRPNPRNSRKRFDEAQLDELAASIRGARCHPTHFSSGNTPRSRYTLTH